MRVGVHNLLAMREDILVIVNPPGGAMRDGVTIVPEERRQKLCPVKYRVGFNAALLAEIATCAATSADPQRTQPPAGKSVDVAIGAA